MGFKVKEGIADVWTVTSEETDSAIKRNVLNDGEDEADMTADIFAETAEAFTAQHSNEDVVDASSALLELGASSAGSAGCAGAGGGTVSYTHLTLPTICSV
eukprot:11008471-Alexandrium_andersonii.AAC.1